MVVARDGSTESFVVEEGTRSSTGPVNLPEEATVYGFGGREPEWTPDFASYVDAVRSELKLRYGGAMIADVSQVLTYGGIFGYPGLRDRPEGKLRVLFEAAPIGHVVEQAGGASTDGRQSLTSIRADDVHQRTPTFVGHQEYVDRLETALVR
jgi:fructose-1,6-bisphosphatase I